MNQIVFQRYNHTINSAAYLTHQSPHITPQNWYLDNVVNHHITPDLANLHHVKEYNGMDQVQVANGQALPIHHTSYLILSLIFKSLDLTNILYVTSIIKHLFSIPRFAHDNDVFFEFHPSHFILKDRASEKPLLLGQSNDGLYSIKLQLSQHE